MSERITFSFTEDLPADPPIAFCPSYPLTGKIHEVEEELNEAVKKCKIFFSYAGGRPKLNTRRLLMLRSEKILDG
jgi:hypothetical protein